MPLWLLKIIKVATYIKLQSLALIIIKGHIQTLLNYTNYIKIYLKKNRFPYFLCALSKSRRLPKYFGTFSISIGRWCLSIDDVTVTCRGRSKYRTGMLKYKFCFIRHNVNFYLEGYHFFIVSTLKQPWLSKWGIHRSNKRQRRI